MSEPAAKKKSPALKKKSPGKKKSPAKADYGGLYFGKDTAEAAAPAEPDEVEDDPMATYRAAAAAAKVAAVKEAAEEAQLQLFKKIFAKMDSVGVGKVNMSTVIEKVAAGTAPLSHRAGSSSRPEGSVALQLPNVFTQVQWINEMKRVSKTMDAPTFEANVLGMFACFDDGEEAAAPAAAPSDASSAAVDVSEEELPTPPWSEADRSALLRTLFDAMDADKDGQIDLNDFLMQARDGEEASELASLFHFFKTMLDGGREDGAGGHGGNDGGDGDGAAAADAELDELRGRYAQALAIGQDSHRAMGGDGASGSSSKKLMLGFEAFANGTLKHTPLGGLRPAAFASAVRGMKADVESAIAIKSASAALLAAVKSGLTPRLKEALTPRGS